ncbi:hypothetical protein ANN_04956 [Periplaneta americana]|uniref:Uncharacterized protein n=1 Tax=Periplaneta americana TaxID=6978 RepID=A0ABQ8TAM4_PERAM|nr:hypothetical protein ANN_04956 [Periplaneta americana]
MDLREVGCDGREWINLALDKHRWWAYIPPYCTVAVGSDVVMKQHPGSNSGAEAAKTAAATGMLHSVYPMQHVSVLSIPPTRWIATSLGSGSGDDDGKQAENKKQRGRRKQLDGGSNLIESRDEPLYGSTPIAQWRNFYGFTYLDISGE